MVRRCGKWFPVPYPGTGREKRKETIPFIPFAVPAYLRRGYYNVILVDWPKLAVLPWYVTAVRNAKVIGPYLAGVMSWLDAQKAVPLSKIHVIGFSLGAEAAGFMGKALAPRKVRQPVVKPGSSFKLHHGASRAQDPADRVARSRSIPRDRSKRSVIERRAFR